MMQNGLHALTWGLQRVAAVLGVIFLVSFVAIASTVTVLVAIQAATGH